MTQVDFMHFPMFCVLSIQALPNSVRWPQNSWILFPNPPNMSRKPRKGFHNLINHFHNLIFHLPVDSSL